MIDIYVGDLVFDAIMFSIGGAILKMFILFIIFLLQGGK